MTAELNDQGLSCSRHRVARIMYEEGIRARVSKGFRLRTTQEDPTACPSVNLLVNEPPASRPGEQIVADIAYIPTRQGWLYLSMIMDLFSIYSWVGPLGFSGH